MSETLTDNHGVGVNRRALAEAHRTASQNKNESNEGLEQMPG
jgi:hypothetical protein